LREKHGLAGVRLLLLLMLPRSQRRKPHCAREQLKNTMTEEKKEDHPLQNGTLMCRCGKNLGENSAARKSAPVRCFLPI
jgi:hypothetical protein